MNDLVLIVEKQEFGVYNGNIWGPLPRKEAVSIVAQMTNDLNSPEGVDTYGSKKLDWELRAMDSVPQYPSKLLPAAIGYYGAFA